MKVEYRTEIKLRVTIKNHNQKEKRDLFWNTKPQNTFPKRNNKRNNYKKENIMQ